MAQVAWTTYEENPGAKPRLLVLFSPSPSEQLHTEEELKLALAASETELRQAWLLPGKGEKLSPQGKKPSEESRHVAEQKKRVEEADGENAHLRNLLKDNEIALGMFKLATEDANLAAENLKREREGVEQTQHQMAEQTAELRTKLEKALQELQQSTEDLDAARKQCEAQKVEATRAKEELEKVQRGYYDARPGTGHVSPVIPSGTAGSHVSPVSRSVGVNPVPTSLASPPVQKPEEPKDNPLSNRNQPQPKKPEKF